MAFGPIEYLVIGFEGNRFTGAIAPELQTLRDNGTIRVIDLVFVTTDAAGAVTVRQATDLTGAEAESYGSLVNEVLGVLTEDDIRKLTAEMSPNSSVLIALFEHAWARRLREAILESGGKLIDQGRLSQEDLDAVSAELAQTAKPVP